MPRLHSYVLRFDGGSAPNPYWGCCTLAICKQRIRRSAEIGDWVVGCGARSAPQGDLSGTVVYAMKVTDKLTMAGYDAYTRAELPEKIPHWTDRDWRRRVGDSIYDFSVEPPAIRRGVHDESQRKRDLSGGYVLLSRHFFYFGDKPIPLPEHLLEVAPAGQGHRSRTNDPLVAPFLAWIDELGLERNRLYGEPQVKRFRSQRRAVESAAEGQAEDKREARVGARSTVTSHHQPPFSPRENPVR